MPKPETVRRRGRKRTLFFSLRSRGDTSSVLAKLCIPFSVIGKVFLRDGLRLGNLCLKRLKTKDLELRSFGWQNASVSLVLDPLRRVLSVFRLAFFREP